MTRYWKSILIMIILAGIVLRLLMLFSLQHGFFEPDNFYYFAVMKETIANGGLIPNPLPLSGISPHIPYQEFPGLIYITLVPYWLTGGLVPLVWVMYAMPVIFGILGILVTYLIAKRFFGGTNVALVAALFYSLLPAAVYRTMALQYRGESFVPVLLGLFVLGQASKNRNYRLASWALVPLMLVIWKAAVYIIPVIAVAFLLMYMEKKRVGIRVQAVVLAVAFAAVLVAANFALAMFEWSPNIEQAITEAHPPSLGTLLLMLNFTVLLAPLAWVYLFVDRKRRASVLWPWLTATLLVMVPFMLLQLRWVFLVGIPMAVFGAKGLEMVYSRMKKTRVPPALPIAIAVALFLSLSVVYLWGQGYIINFTPELEAATWISHNTSQNSTFLSFWGDSSIIEGWGNRTTYIESVNANGTGIEDYARFLLAQNGNYSYIKEVRPDYLFISNWTSPTIFEEEGNLTNANINLSGTNLDHLVDGTAGLPIVYDYNSVIIYNVTSLWKN
jgi:asparagine N-glycosylation enzyme membrane subunit Stt3